MLAIAVSFVLAVGAAVGAFAVTDHARDRPNKPIAHAPAAPSAAVAATAAPTAGRTAAPSSAPGEPDAAGSAATRAGISDALRSLATARGLGSRLRADVIDVASGTTLYSSAPSVPTAPASTAKLLVASAILSVRSASDRITTRVLAGPGHSVVLVGGGDPTLSAAAASKPTEYGDAARISVLAAQVRRAIPNPSTISQVFVDDSLFSGPTVSPDWAPEDVPSDYGAPVTAAMIDGGRSAPGDVIRSAHPDLDAGRALAVALGRPAIPVSLGSPGSAGGGADVLGAVKSAPIASLVEQMLEESDNVIAEMLGRQVALAKGVAPSFVGAARAIRSVLIGIGVDPGSGMRDASGLAAADRLTPRALTGVLTAIGNGHRPELAVVGAALPVAGWSGTLSQRYVSGAAVRGRGVIRAKTGTLTGVSTLAGLVRDRSGHLLAFALMADRTTSTQTADQALDRLAARLSVCGCT